MLAKPIGFEDVLENPAKKNNPELEQKWRTWKPGKHSLLNCDDLCKARNHRTTNPPEWKVFFEEIN